MLILWFYKFQEICKHSFHKHYILIYIDCLRIYARFATIVFSCLTGYIGQEDDLYFWREAFNVHFLGGGFNHVIHLSTTNESREYLFHSFTIITFTSFLLNIGDNVQPKCKGDLNLFLRTELDMDHNNIK